MAQRSTKDWRSTLVESYADLFGTVGDPLGVAGWPAVGDGWRDLLQRACARIRAAVRDDGGSFVFTQIKEKYAGARLYWTGSLSPEAAARVEEAIDLAEARATTTCDVCGDLGLLRGGGWLATRCDAHAEGRPAIEVEEGFENLHVERRAVGGRTLVRYRIYDRDADAFVEVQPPDGEE